MHLCGRSVVFLKPEVELSPLNQKFISLLFGRGEHINLSIDTINTKMISIGLILVL